jgi:protoporphyrin/coproporphyrin ferrochelatase
VKEALLIVNMGGPTSLEQVREYLRAIFRDPAILPFPAPLRGFLATLISSRRSGPVADRYRLIGGHSPLLHWTERLRSQLELALRQSGEPTNVAYAFRYTAPLIPDALAVLKQDGVEHVTVLPLFPHYTPAMSGSILLEVRQAAQRLAMSWSAVDAWGLHADVLDLWSRYLNRSVDLAGDGARVLFVAHGVPLRNVRRGDTYPHQVRESAERLAAMLPNGTSWSLAYQSKVGPVEWTGPYLENELQRLAAYPEPLVIMPLSFAADCLETLYDLDHVAMETARTAGVESVVRVRVFNDDPEFARALATMVMEESHVS